MSEAFLGEIRQFGGQTVPRGWAPCEGQTLAISTNQALFSILGTQFGGDGVSTFKLPDLRARVPLGAGGTRSQGQIGGEEAHTLTVAEMPSHTHAVTASSTATPLVPPISDHFWAAQNNYAEAANAVMGATAIATAGGSAPHSNMQPYLAVSFCIATSGIYPSRP